MRSRIALRSSSPICPLDTWRERWPLMVAKAALTRSSAASLMETANPAWAATSAMPAPIWPAPITPTVSMLNVISFSSEQPAPRDNHRRAATSVQSGAWLFAWPDSAPDLRELGGKFGQSRIEISDQAVVGYLEDRRLLVLVDGHDDLRILHPRQMLDRARDADGNIEVRRHHLAGLADLPVIGCITGVDRGAGGAHRRSRRKRRCARSRRSSDRLIRRSGSRCRHRSAARRSWDR